MVKDVRLCLEEVKALGLRWKSPKRSGVLGSRDPRHGPEFDFTSAIKPIEKAAGVVVGGERRPRGEVTDRFPGRGAASWRVPA